MLRHSGSSSKCFSNKERQQNLLRAKKRDITRKLKGNEVVLLWSVSSLWLAYHHTVLLAHGKKRERTSRILLAAPNYCSSKSEHFSSNVLSSVGLWFVIVRWFANSVTRINKRKEVKEEAQKLKSVLLQQREQAAISHEPRAMQLRSSLIIER